MADSNFQFITYDDIKEILGENSVLFSEVKKSLNDQTKALDRIQILCDFFLKQLDITINDETLQNNGMIYSRQYQMGRHSRRGNNKAKLYEMGMKIIYSLRSFLLQEEILFDLGMSYDSSLHSKQLTQSEMFQYVKANLSSGVIQLESSLFKMQNSTLSTVGDQLQSVNQEQKAWSLIEQYAMIDDENGQATKIPGTSHPEWFRKTLPDVNVYMRYANEKHQKLYYYRQKQFYNRGWLYEWFKSYISQDESNLAQLLSELLLPSNTPLVNFMEGRSGDNVINIKGGDYINAQGQQVQAKYGNVNIITFNSIRKAIGTISIIIKKWKSGGSIEDQKLVAQEFKNLFTTNEKGLNKYYENITDTILNQLKIAGN